LERTLGIDLLQRSSRGVTLTPAGVALVADTPPLLALAEHLRDETTRSRRSMEGRCVIGAVATAASSALLTRVVRTCAARLPHVQLVVEEMPTPSQPVALEQGAIDLGLAHAFPATAHRRGTSIVVTRVHSDRLDSVLLPAAHPLGARSRIDARDLAELPFLFMARGFHPGFYDRVFAALGKLRLVPRVDATYDGLQTVWALTAQGMGWTLGFHSQRRHPPAGTVAVPIVGFDLPWGLDLLSRRGEPSGAVSAVIKLFRDAGRSKRRG
jgi:DNA-binding transcriptional LysR family regulator